MNDHDFTEIPDEEFPEEGIEAKRKSGCFLKFAALFTLLAFIVFTVPNFSYLLTDKFSFLKQNTGLIDDEIVIRCKPAVVTIEAVVTSQPLHTTVHRGTGFNVYPSGTIITNQHVVEGADSITVAFSDGQRYCSKRIVSVPGADIAVIEIEGANLPVLTLNRQDRVQSGDIVTVIGNPLGFEKVAQRGNVGEYHKEASNKSLVFDIKLPANPGSSGSPVINDQAQVVGIVFASTTVDANGISDQRALAIPIQVVPKDILP